MFRAFVCVCALALRATLAVRSHVSEYDAFRLRFGRADSDPHIESRKILFERRFKDVEAHNARPDKLWVAEVNRFADYTHEEMQQIFGYRRVGSRWAAAAAQPVSSSFLQAEEKPSMRTENLAESVDWRQQLNYSDEMVRDQGGCGSCWAVAAVGALETHAEIAGGLPAPLSYEQLVDCTPNPKHCGGQGGCAGATSELAFEYVKKHGVVFADHYQGYQTGGDGKCRQPTTSKLFVGGFNRLPENRLYPLMEAVTKGPVVVSVDANLWSMYRSGIFNSCKRDAIVNHAVLMIGYGVDPDLDNRKYWLIRNSWGRGYGEAGHIRVLRHDSDTGEEGYCGVDTKPQEGVGCDNGPRSIPICGMCGILSDSSYPFGVNVKSL